MGPGPLNIGPQIDFRPGNSSRSVRVVAHSGSLIADRTVPIRVGLAELPSALHHSLEREIGLRPDMRVVAIETTKPLDRVDLLLGVAQDIDLLVLGTRDAASPPGICDHLLGEFPTLLILLVSHGGDQAILHWHGPRRLRVRRISANSLMRATRHALAVGTVSVDRRSAPAGRTVQPDCEG
jgi:hypothetical protein